MDQAVLWEALELLSARHMEDVEWKNDTLTGSLGLAEAGRVILSVPYEAGWQVRVNGEEARGELFGGCLMAFDLEPGEYRFEMKYVPEGSGAGIMVSIMSIAAFCGITALRRRRGRPQKPVETERNDRAAACGAEAKEGAGRENT